MSISFDVIDQILTPSLDAVEEEQQQRAGEIEVPEEILVAAASGPGTTLGGPQ